MIPRLRPIDARSGPAFRVLIVDDNPSVHADFTRIFEPEEDASAAALDELEAGLFGAGDRNAPSGEAFALWHASQCDEGVGLTRTAIERNAPFDVAFVDMKMPPGPNGVETTRRLWSIDPVLQVVLCTAYRDFRWAEVMEFLGSTANLHLLRKPFSPAQARHIAGVLAAKAARLRRSAA
jgi:two-component system NtrC family sensor kinase